MTPLTADQILTIAVPLVLVVVWAVRLEGRINLTERINSQVLADLQYIRKRLDAMTGIPSGD